MNGSFEQSTIKVIIADDHAVVRKGLQAYFAVTEDIEVVATIGCAADVAQAVKQCRPQVVLLDLLMPEQPAVKTIEQIKAVDDSVHIVILTSHEGSEYIAEVLKAGALSYILKNIDPDELVATIRKAASGESILNARLAQTLVEQCKGINKELYESLTERERQVVQFIAQGMTNGEIAELLFISEKTVKSHVSNILGKLYLSDRTKVAIFAWKEGLIKEA
jgi:NarL family two-component system response regulator LiaR